MNKIFINVTIDQIGSEAYIWKYQSDYPGFDNSTGMLKFMTPGITEVTYTLQSDQYSLIYVNLDPKDCATREFRNLAIDTQTNSVTLVDANGAGKTGTTPISIRLIARVKGDPDAPIISPDPQVVDDPPPHQTGHHHHRH